MISDKVKKKVHDAKPHWAERDTSTAYFLKMVKQGLGKLEGIRVLDAGCARGEQTAKFSANKMDAVGIDSEESFISDARNKHPGMVFDVGRIEKMPYKRGSFDAVYCVNTLFYSKPEESLPELQRVVKKGGILFVTLDERITDLDKKKVIHELDVEKALKFLNKCGVMTKTYHERVDDTPFKHKHEYYEVVLRRR